MLTVIRLSRGHLLPASRPAGHNLRVQHDRQHRFTPTLDQHRNADCPAGHNQRLAFDAQSMLKCRMHCVASTNACPWILDLLLLAETCLNDH
ncbi:hypothetical protein LF1_55360 [Rubripirellula obstinata]|uniref:Uncharacterized protein n=1 Tax=Rubripirellula obstinata TaxID=406547 RepID=A0A5B1C9D5_9BACT|nr:hypothetical protein LF1_55360 [Rubripirellula obstinata]